MVVQRTNRGRLLFRYAVGTAVAAALHAPLVIPSHGGGRAPARLDVRAVMELNSDMREVAAALAAMEKKVRETPPPAEEPDKGKEKGDEKGEPAKPAAPAKAAEAAKAPEPPKATEIAMAPVPAAPPPLAAPPASAPREGAPPPPPPAKGRPDVPEAQRVKFREAEQGRDGDETRVGPRNGGPGAGGGPKEVATAPPPKAVAVPQAPPPPAEPKAPAAPRPAAPAPRPDPATAPKLAETPRPVEPAARPVVAASNAPGREGDVAIASRPAARPAPAPLRPFESPQGSAAAAASAAAAGPHPAPAASSAHAPSIPAGDTTPVSAPGTSRRGVFPGSGAGGGSAGAPQGDGFEVPTIYTQGWSSLDERIAATRYFGMQLIAYPPTLEYFVVCNLATKTFEPSKEIDYVRSFSNRILHQEGTEIEDLRKKIGLWMGVDTSRFVFAYFIPVKTANHFARRELAVCRAAGFDPSRVESVSVRFVRELSAERESWLLVVDALRTKDGRTLLVGERENRAQD